MTDDLPAPTRQIKHNESGIVCTISADLNRREKSAISVQISRGQLRLRIENKQMELKLDEDLAVSIAEYLIDIVGQIGADRATFMIAEARRERAEFEDAKRANRLLSDDRGTDR